MMSRSAHQDWFMMTGDLIINLTNNKSTDIYNKKNFKFKTAPNLMSSNSEPNTCVTTPVNQLNDQNSRHEHKQTQTFNHLNDTNDHQINELAVKRQMSLPLVRFSKSDDHLITSDDLTVVDINDSDDCCSNSLNTLIDDKQQRQQQQQLKHDNQLSNNLSPDYDNDHVFNDDDEELLTTPRSYSLSENSSANDSLKSDSNNSQITISSANMSPTKTMNTITVEQTESSMSENYSIVSSISCQTIDQNRNKCSFKVHNNQTLSLSSSNSDDTNTPSSSPEEQLLNPNSDQDFGSSTLEDVSYSELNGEHKVCEENTQLMNNKIKSPSLSSAQKTNNNWDALGAQQSYCNSDEESSEIESLHSFNYSPFAKGVDTPSASRLAKRLYNLEGFKKSDVSRHLSKNNEFSRVVAEEYLKYFDFSGDTLDLALRKFLSRFCLIGETQERERVLVHFSKRFLDCNPNSSFKSNDAIHTLTCALMLLNTDLHGENVVRKMTCNEFIQNLSEMNDGEDFERDILRILYQGIKQSPLEWNADGEDNTNQIEGNRMETNITSANLNQQISTIGHNPFLEVPNPNCATEYKKGYVMRKSCYECNGKKTPIGKRGWKMFYATLRDLVLYLHKDEQGFRKNQLYESLNNSIRVHHALASKATDYSKKQFVFRLITADHAEYLFQTSDSRELQVWIDTINTVSASLSSPPLPEAVGSNTKKFERPLLPVSHTKLNLREQLNDQENRILRLQIELEDHLSKAPEKGSSKRLMNEFAEKESYLQHELKRYRSYVSALKWKLSQMNSINIINTPVISSVSTPPLLSVAIGEETSEDLSDSPVITVKRSNSTDRDSYKQAIHNNSHKRI